MQSFDLFQYLADHRSGILIFFLCLIGLALIIQWFSWIFGWGRFARRKELDAKTARNQSIRFLLADLLIKIIDDFRHLLALVIVLIFALALATAMYVAGANMDQLKEAMQVVVATLGGLVGSIIGYYFGESAVARRQAGGGAASTVAEQQPGGAVQDGSSANDEDLEAAPTPDALGGSATPDDPDAPDDTTGES